jgi:hypothetical protein
MQSFFIVNIIALLVGKSDFFFAQRKIRFKEELGFVCIKAKHSVKLALDLWKESYS